MGPRRALVAVLLGSGVAAAGYRRRALTADGAIAAAVVGASTFGFGGAPAAAALIAFFVSGSALSRRRPVADEVRAAKGHRRDALQVAANGGVAALAAVLGAAGLASAPGATLGALAAASADTWASELGVYSPTMPRSIVTGRTVPPGTSGGVTALGWLAAAGGAGAVGLAHALAMRERRVIRHTFGVALASGLLGSLTDSLAGATLQAGYRCPSCGHVSEAPGEHCGTSLTLVRGVGWATNDSVNIICTVAGGLAGALLWRRVPRASPAGASGRRGGQIPANRRSGRESA